MSQAVEPIPAGYHTVTPHLVVADAAAAIAFYQEAFGAEELIRVPTPDGQGVLHAEIKIGDSPVMLADELPEFGGRSPQSLGGSPVAIHLYVEDVEAVFKRAVDAGATAVMPPTDMFWGDRYGRLTDPFGHYWSLATHMRDPTPEELQAGAKAAFSK